MTLSLCDAAAPWPGKRGQQATHWQGPLEANPEYDEQCEGRWCLFTVMCPCFLKAECTGWADVSRADPTQEKGGGRVPWGDMAAD